MREAGAAANRPRRHRLAVFYGPVSDGRVGIAHLQMRTVKWWAVPTLRCWHRWQGGAGYSCCVGAIFLPSGPLCAWIRPGGRAKFRLSGFPRHASRFRSAALHATLRRDRSRARTGRRVLLGAGSQRGGGRPQGLLHGGLDRCARSGVRLVEVADPGADREENQAGAERCAAGVVRSIGGATGSARLALRFDAAVGPPARVAGRGGAGAGARCGCGTRHRRRTGRGRTKS